MSMSFIYLDKISIGNLICQSDLLRCSFPSNVDLKSKGCGLVNIEKILGYIAGK